ncbi:hypothetical protein [uncultured Clostridium sp.]|nr:hypothetical protein [uncultured Clostridium sp.]
MPSTPKIIGRIKMTGIRQIPGREPSFVFPKAGKSAENICK